MRAEFDVDAASASRLGNHDHPFPGFLPPLVPQVELTRLRMPHEYFAAGDESGWNRLGAFAAGSSIAVPICQSVSQLASFYVFVNDQ
jgi:hypothetical protein